MKYKRYGTGFLKDLWAEYLLLGAAALIFTLFGLWACQWDIPKSAAARAGEIAGRLLPVGFILLAGCVMFGRIYTECFQLEGNVITTKREGTIVIPDQVILLITPACIVRRAKYGFRNQTLKGKYAVTIIAEELERAAEILHAPPTRTNHPMDWMMDSYFEPQKLLYGFVCSQQLLDKLLETGNHIVIVPQRIKNVFRIDPAKAQVFADTGDWSWTK